MSTSTFRNLAGAAIAAAVTALTACGGGSASCPDGWCPVTSPPAGRSLTGVWGSAADDVWIVGGPSDSVLHWDGSVISAVSTGTTASLLGVWGSGSADVWAVGHTDGPGIILHWDGSAWSAAAVGDITKLNCVWGTGPTDV